MDENDDIETPEEHPAEKRIRDRETRELRAENAILKAGLTLNDDQRSALLAVVKDDLSPETVKAKAETLGFVPAVEVEPSAEVAHVAATEERIATAALGSVPPAPPVAPLISLHERVATAPVSQLEALRQEAMQAIAQAGLSFGTLEHDGAFQPTGRDM